MFSALLIKRYSSALTDIHKSCLSLFPAVNWISRPGVETMMLLLNKPGGCTLISSIDLTLDMNTDCQLSVSYKRMLKHSPLLEDDSDAVELPGSSALQ